MSQTRTKCRRMRRVHSLESSRLSAMVAEVVRIDGERTRLAKSRVELLRHRDDSLFNYDSARLELLSQTTVWVERLDERLAEIDRLITELLRVRQEAQERVLEQRSKVRGLELLIDQLLVEIRAEDDAEEMRTADESALKNYSRK